MPFRNDVKSATKSGISARNGGVVPAALIAVLLVACGDAPPEPELVIGCCSYGAPNAPIFLVKAALNNGGDGQTALAGATLTDSLVVRVVTATGFPVGGVRVRWVTDSGGSISPAFINTNDNGIAKAQWTLGAKPGLQSVTAAADNTPNPVQFWSIATAQPLPNVPYFTALAGGNHQSAPAGSPLADSLAVVIATTAGFPVVGVAVYWVTSGGGSISPTISYTNRDGVAKARWTLGPQPGEQRASGSPSPSNPHFAIVATALEPVAGLRGSAGRER